MKDLTKDSIVSHILTMAAPIAFGMLIQMAYQLIDIYFVGQLGEVAVAGVASAANLGFLILALTQVLGVGTVAVIAHAVGRKDQADATLIFNQSVSMALVCALLTIVFGYLFGSSYMASIAADEASKQEGITFLYWFLPGMALQFGLITMGSALRGTGIVQPTMVVQMLTAIINAFLAPVLIAGWLTGHPMGVAGAGLATSISVLIGVIMMSAYFMKLEHYVKLNPVQLKPQLKQWARMLNVGLPAGGEFALMFVYLGVIYYVIGGFGNEAQAGFGFGSRIMQAIMLPAMAIAFAAGPIAGQNFGAQLPERVKETFFKTATLSTVIMAAITVFSILEAELFMHVFTKDPAVIEVGATFLRFISLNYIAQGLIFTCSGMFQGLGNTLPSLISSFTRMVTFVFPAWWASTQPWFVIEHVWYLSIATVTLQAAVSLLLLRAEFTKRLQALNFSPAT